MNKRCAILKKVNFTNDEKELKDLEKLFILYCKEKLKIDDYEVFLNKKELENKILTDEYTDLLVYDKKQFSISVQGIELHYLNESEESYKNFIYNEFYQIIKKYTNSENIRFDKDAKQMIKKYEERFNEKLNFEEEDFIYSVHKSLMKKFRWNTIENIEDLENSLKENDALKVLEIEDAIADTMFDLLNKELGDVYTDEVLITIYNNPKTTEKLKEFIILYFKSNVISKEIRKLI